MNAYRYVADRIVPSREKIVYRGQRLTGDDFLRQVKRLAAYLTCLGVKRGDVVAIALPNVPQAIIALYAADALGCVVNLLSPKLGEEGLRKAVGPDTKVLFLLPSMRKKAKSVYVPKIFCGLTEYGALKWFFLISPFFSGTFSHAMTVGADMPLPDYFGKREGEEPAFLLHSAGTTGDPKTVVLSSDALNSLVDNVMTAVKKLTDADPEMGMLACLPLFHGFGLGIGIHLAMSRIRCLPMARFSAKKAVRIMKTDKVSVLAGVPSMFRKLAERKDFDGAFLKNIELIFCGGDRLDPAVKEKFEAILRKNDCYTPVMEGYGMSEAASVVTINVSRPDNASVGQPIPGVEIAVDAEGEILLRSESMMLGYLEEGRIVPCQREHDGKSYFPTGDVGELRDGDLYLFDRKKRTIKIGGNNVFPKEIEEIALRHPSVEDAVAARITWEGKPAVKLLIVPTKKAGPHIENELRELIGREASRYSVPRVIERVKEIKKTPLGKSDYRYYEE